MLNSIIKEIVFAAGVITVIGIFILSALHIILMLRLKKVIFTLLPVLFFPAHELLEFERYMRKIGIYLSLIGSVPIIIYIFYNN
jgi:hypothetical protein